MDWRRKSGSQVRNRERAAADILSALRRDLKALEAGDTGQGPGQTAGTGDQKLVDEPTEAWSRVLCPPHLRDTNWLHGEVQNQTTGPLRTPTVSIFLLEMKLLVTERSPVGSAADFPSEKMVSELTLVR